MFWLRMGRLLSWGKTLRAKTHKLLTVRINSSFQGVLILIHTCNFLLWEAMLSTISMLGPRQQSLEEQLHSSILPFPLRNKQCQSHTRDGGIGQIQKWTATMVCMQRSQAGTRKLLVKWDEWWKRGSVVSSSLWPTREFSAYKTQICSKHSRLPGTWELCAWCMLKTGTSSQPTNKDC